MFTIPVGFFPVIPVIYRPSVAAVGVVGDGYVTNAANAYDTSDSTNAIITSGILATSSASVSYYGFPPVLTKSATLTISCNQVGISGAAACVVTVYNGGVSLTSWVNAALTFPTVTYALADGINMANISVQFNAENMKVAHGGKGTSLFPYYIQITQ